MSYINQHKHQSLAYFILTIEDNNIKYRAELKHIYMSFLYHIADIR